MDRIVRDTSSDNGFTGNSYGFSDTYGVCAPLITNGIKKNRINTSKKNKEGETKNEQRYSK